jgi:hypothetical protein
LNTELNYVLFKRHEAAILTKRIPPDATADEGITNDQRASWAEVGLLAFGQLTGMVREHVGDKEDPFLIVADLLGDLAHWCDRNDVDMRVALRLAAQHYDEETGGEGEQF